MPEMTFTPGLADIVQRLQERLQPERRGWRGSAIHERLKPAPHIKCADGFIMSVQTGLNIYCTPRDNTGPWSEVEVGYPSERVDALMPFVEDPSDPTQTVYSYVPIETVAQVILDHGGFALPQPQRGE